MPRIHFYVIVKLGELIEEATVQFFGASTWKVCSATFTDKKCVSSQQLVTNK
jgi:hypothetical protein